MRCTHEADYAIRVTCCLAFSGSKVGAKQISESTGVTLRFALKILRKLIQADIVKSFKGASGGYMLKSFSKRNPALEKLLKRLMAQSPSTTVSPVSLIVQELHKKRIVISAECSAP